MAASGAGLKWLEVKTGSGSVSFLTCGSSGSGTSEDWLEKRLVGFVTPSRKRKMWWSVRPGTTPCAVFFPLPSWSAADIPLGSSEPDFFAKLSSISSSLEKFVFDMPLVNIHIPQIMPVSAGVWSAAVSAPQTRHPELT